MKYREYVHSLVVFKKYLSWLGEMKYREYVHSLVVFKKYLSRLGEFINFIRSLGEKIINSHIVIGNFQYTTTLCTYNLYFDNCILSS